MGGHISMAQDSMVWKKGELTFKSSVNCYIKFDNTTNIHVGDKLYFVDDTLKALLEVNYISSTSCVCKKLVDTAFAIGTRFIIKINIKESEPLTSQKDFFTVENKDTSVSNVSKDEKPKKKTKSAYGRLAISSYTSFSSPTGKANHTLRYTMVYHAHQLGQSRIGAESYISFRHKPGEWQAIKTNPFQYLKIYNLALKYESKKNDVYSFGRKINLNISNLGAIDGFQYDKKSGNLLYGIIFGSRPNDADYGVNFQLMQTGAYIGNVMHNTSGGEANNTFAFFEQHHGAKTDRRFIYLQHTNSLLKNLFAFSSAEFDLYKISNGVPATTISPTSLYLSLRYKPFKRLSMDVSYDALKNVIYYESFKNYLDQLLEKETRQGLRGGVTFEPAQWLSIGGNAGYRFQADHKNASENADVYLSSYNIPGLMLSATLNGTFIRSDYLQGTILGLRAYRSFFHDKLSMDTYLRKVRYNYPNQDGTIDQKIVSFSINANLFKKTSLSMNYEGTFERSRKYFSFYTNLIRRF